MRRAPLAGSGRALGCAASVALLSLACGSARPLPAYAIGNADDPKFPRSRFIVEVGTSSQSAEDAELQARAKISADISAELTSETGSFLRASGSSESQSVSVEVKQKTHFDRADLIVVTDHADANGIYYTRAVLDRAKADGELARAQQADLVSFTQFADSALQASQAGKQGDFSSAKMHALKLLPSVDAAFIVRRAVLARPSEEEQRFLAERNALLKAAAESESHRVIEVRVDGTPSPQLLELAVAAVRKLGLRVGENQTCEQVVDHPSEATELVLSPEENCGEGSLGEKCEVAIRLHARGCQGGGEGEGRTPMVRGIHPSDRDRARAAAWKRVTSDTVETAVGVALRGAQVVECGAGPGC